MIGDLCAFLVGAACGWLCHRHREKLTRLKERIKHAVEDEL